ncbi:MAG: hypothetical protein WD552_01365 [Candidatus Paceibacterota bacterium]
MSNENKKKSHTGLIAGVSAALAAGAVYFFGPEGDKHRWKLRGWVLKTRGEVLESLEDLEVVSKEKYEEIVDAAIAKFAEQKAEKELQVEELRHRLKSEWSEIKKQAEEKGEDLRVAAADVIAEKSEELADDIDLEEK